jgi:hypothetical protein
MAFERAERIVDTLDAHQLKREAERHAAISLLVCPARACKRAHACRHSPCTAFEQLLGGPLPRGGRVGSRGSTAQAACDAG